MLFRSASPNKLKVALSTGLTSGVIMNMVCIALADDDIVGFGQKLVTLGSEIYDAALGVVSVFAAIMLVIAYILRMNANTQKAALATSWIFRIVVGYLGVNTIGLTFKIIENTTKGMGFMTTP